MELSPRLALVASMITKGASVCDVGTDHGYLPIWLAKSGDYGNIIATDIRQKPLNKGMENAALAGAADMVDFRLCDGLAAVRADEVDEVVICGMGGENITDILRSAPWTREKRVIIQPARSADVLRAWLAENGYVILTERLVTDAGLMYSIIRVGKGETGELTPAEAYVSKALLHSGDPMLYGYIDRMIKILKDAADGTARSSKPFDSERHTYFTDALNGVLAMRKELENDNSGKGAGIS